MSSEKPKWVPYVPLAATVGLTKSGLLSPGLIDAPLWIFFPLLALSIVVLIPEFRRGTHKQVDCYRPENVEYPPFPWVRVAAPWLILAAGDVSQAFGFSLGGTISPWVPAGSLFLIITVALTYSFTHLQDAAIRQGPRRARMLAARGLESVTAHRIDVMSKHRQFATGLINMNSFDGTRAQARLVANFQQLTATEVLDKAKELESVGLAKISPIMFPDEPEKWWVELTELGVRTLAATQRR
ncbi:hypothetical protein [Corynebacterium epidermidicanis]|nr:hypothetical protein [Corynebacterium epidermidicanis]